FAGCDMLVGPQGEQGEQGEQGPASEGLYLVDNDGVRVSSGGSYYLGEVLEFAPTSLTFELRFLNFLGVDVELVSISEVFSYVIRPDGTIEKVNAVDEIDVQFTNGQSVADDSLSDVIEFSFDYIHPFNQGSSIVRKRYRFDIGVGEDEMYFDVELYGLLTQESG
ncbi:MAG: hypothetical protein EA426_20270, partial [Spirochaetaceae bacterium]